jgi:hypothetical protein
MRGSKVCKKMVGKICRAERSGCCYGAQNFT